MCSRKWKWIVQLSMYASIVKQRWIFSQCCSLLQVLLFVFSVLPKIWKWKKNIVAMEGEKIGEKSNQTASLQQAQKQMAVTFHTYSHLWAILVPMRSERGTLFPFPWLWPCAGGAWCHWDEYSLWHCSSQAGLTRIKCFRAPSKVDW